MYQAGFFSLLLSFVKWSQCAGFKIKNYKTNLVEELRVWTSGVPCASNDTAAKTTGKCKSLTWCSSNKTKSLNYTISSKKEAPCVVYDRTSKSFKDYDCTKTALVFCEVVSLAPFVPDLHKILNSNNKFTANLQGQQMSQQESLQEKRKVYSKILTYSNNLPYSIYPELVSAVQK